MSWISDLAGKAENILNKIDQNAASVLKSETDNKNASGERRSSDEPSIVEGLRKNLSSSSLSLTKTLSPKKLLRGIDLQISSQRSTISNDENVQKVEKSNSRLSSRRSSFSSKAEGTVIECEISTPEMIEADSSLSKQQQKQSDFNNAEKELADLRIALAEITSERNDLCSEVVQLQEEVKQATGMVRIEELENLVAELSQERENLSSEHIEMKQNCMEYVKSMTELETNLSKARQTILELSEKLDWQTRETNQHAMELEQYRKKAHATLQMKDKIISELKGKNQTDEIMENDNQRILQIEIDGLRQENSNLNDELKLSRIQLEDSKKIIQQLEQKSNELIKERNSLEENLRKTVNHEQQKSLQLESDVKLLQQELFVVREEMQNQRQLFSMKINEKDVEIMRMQSQSDQSGFGGDSNGLEERIQSLTQALVQKQGAIETITAEKNALRLQLEKTNDKVRQVMAQNKLNQAQIINVNDTDDAKAQLPFIMRENPFDTNVTRRVKRAYSSLDSAGIRIGVFLRRYPLVRILVFMYVALLHLWVMFVLFSSTPT